MLQKLKFKRFNITACNMQQYNRNDLQTYVTTPGLRESAQTLRREEGTRSQVRLTTDCFNDLKLIILHVTYNDITS